MNDVGRADALESTRRCAFTRATRPMDLFELGRVGLPCALVGTLFLISFGPRLLPNRTDMLEQLGTQRREYLLEMLVQADCPLSGQTPIQRIPWFYWLAPTSGLVVSGE